MIKLAKMRHTAVQLQAGSPLVEKTYEKALMLHRTVMKQTKPIKRGLCDLNLDVV